MPQTETYRYRGTDRRGDGHYGTAGYAPGAMAAQVEKWFSQGWRELTVCRGDGPVPPAADEQTVGAIERHPDTGRRIWWAEP